MRIAMSVVVGALACALVAASPPSGDTACPGAVPSPGFVDVAPGATHGPGIACVAVHGIAQGVTTTTYRPSGSVQRGQMASFVVRLLRAAGTDMPVPTTGRFQDLGGSAHADNIEALAALGVVNGTSATTFAPIAPVRRDQMASFLVGVLATLEVGTPTGPDAPVTGTPFTDVSEDNRHVAAIARLAAEELVLGTSATVYDPAGWVTRGQMASLLTRIADLAAGADLVHAPHLVRDAVIPGTTLVLDASEREDLTDVGADGTLTFASLPYRIEPNMVVVSAPTPAAPAGLLRRVTAVGGTEIRTEPAALTEAIHAGSGRASHRLTLDTARDAEVAAGVEVTAPTSTSLRVDLGDGAELADGVTATGSVTLTLDTEVAVDIAQREGDAPYVVRLAATTGVTQDAPLVLRATAAGSLDRELPLFRAVFAPIVVDVGGVPVVLVPELQVVLGADGQVAATTRVAARQRAIGLVGNRLTAAGGWQPVARWDAQDTDPEQELTAAADVEVGTTTTLGFSVYGEAPFATSATSTLRAMADPERIPGWTVDAGTVIGTRAGSTPDLLPGVVPAERIVYRDERRIATAPPPPPLAPEPIRLAAGWFAAPGTGPTFGTAGTTYRYTVEIRDGLSSRQDLEGFRAFVDARLGDPDKGWTSRGVRRMQRVDDPARAHIRIVLASPATTDQLCGQVGLKTGGIYSCWNGRFAVINSYRWFGGVSHVPDLELYRSYLINHEVGHGLGNGHRSCPAPGRIAPVMMQLTKSTYGCIPNPHPYP